MGLVELLNSEKVLTKVKIKEYAEYFNVLIKELDMYVQEMSSSLAKRRREAVVTPEGIGLLK